MPKAKQHELDEAFSYGRRAADQDGAMADCPYVQRDMQKAWKSGYRTRMNERTAANVRGIAAY